MFLTLAFAICFSADLEGFSQPQLIAMIEARREMPVMPKWVRVLQTVKPIFERIQKAHDNNFVTSLKEVADAYEHTAKRAIELSLQLNKSDEVSGYLRSVGGGLQLAGTTAAIFGTNGGNIAKVGKVATTGGRFLTLTSTIQDLTSLIIKDTELKKRYKELEDVIEKHKDLRKTYLEIHRDFERLKFLAQVLEESVELNELGLAENLNDDIAEAFALRYRFNIRHGIIVRKLIRALRSITNFSNQMNFQFGLQTRSNWTYAFDVFFASLDMSNGIASIIIAHQEKSSLQVKLAKAEEQKKYLKDEADNINTAITTLLSEFSEMPNIDLDRIARQHRVDELPVEVTELFHRRIQEIENNQID